MDALVLLGSFMVLMLIGMPVAFALGLASLVGALWISLPLDGVMIQIASVVNNNPRPKPCSWPTPRCSSCYSRVHGSWPIPSVLSKSNEPCAAISPK